MARANDGQRETAGLNSVSPTVPVIGPDCSTQDRRKFQGEAALQPVSVAIKPAQPRRPARRGALLSSTLFPALRVSVVIAGVLACSIPAFADGGIGGWAQDSGSISWAGAGGVDSTTAAGGAGGGGSGSASGGGGGGAGVTGGVGGAGAPDGGGGAGGVNPGDAGSVGSGGASGGGGGGGAHGLTVTTGGSYTQTGTVTGGAGGVGAIGAVAAGGGGGAGGYGAVLGVGATINGSVIGGAGGAGGFSGAVNEATAGGSGGSGGMGLYFTTGTLTINSGAAIRGGLGGVAGDTNDGSAGSNGAGGMGLMVAGNLGAISNAGTISGGVGGPFGSASYGVSGIGMEIAGTGNTFSNLSGASIIGASRPMMASGVDNGGVGLLISGNSNIVTNAGTIAGGSDGNGPPMGTGVPGVVISGDDNTLTLQSGLVYSGGFAVISVSITGDNNTLELWSGGINSSTRAISSGALNTFVLGGSTDGTLDPALLHPTAPVSGDPGYSGFSLHQKDGTSTWSITGSSIAGETTNWQVLDGTLVVGTLAGSGTSATAFQANVDVIGGMLEVAVVVGGNTTNLIGNVDVRSGALARVVAGTVTGNITVHNGGELDFFRPFNNGAATVTGSVTVQSGGILSVKSNALPTTAVSTVGSLVMNTGGNLNVEIGTQVPIIQTMTVTNLTLDGTINVTGDVSWIGANPYLIINYTTLVHNGVTAGTAPAGYTFTVSDTGSAIYLNFAQAALGLYWNGGSTSGGPNGGTGTWNSTNTNWTNAAGTAPSAWDGSVAIFSVAQVTNNVTVVGPTPGDISVKGMDFQVDDYNISGDTITLAATSGQTGIAVATGASATIFSVLRGTTGLEKTGDGTLLLTGANTYTGGTTITGGTLSIGHGGTSGSVVGNIADNAALIFNRSDALTYAGVISGTGTVEKLGAGTLTLTGANIYTGGTTITAGTLEIGGGGSSGSISGAITNNATLAFNRSDDVSYAGVISGSGAVSKLAANTLTLSGVNTYTGATTVSAGILRITGASGLGTNAAGTTVVSGASLLFDSGSAMTVAEGLTISGSGASGQNGALIGGSTSATLTGGVVLAADASVDGGNGLEIASQVSGSGKNLSLIAGGTVSGVIATGSGQVIKAGSAIWVLSGANTYSGATTISGGAIVAQNATALGTTDAGTTVSAGGSLVIDGNVAVGAEALSLSGAGFGPFGALTGNNGAGSFAGAITLAADSRILVGVATASNTLSLSGGITGSGMNLTMAGVGTGTESGAIATGAGTVTKTGTGSWILSGANTYTGATTVSAGTLVVANATGLGTIAGGTTVASGATLSLTGNITVGAEALTLSGTGVSNAGALNSSGTGAATFQGAITLAADTTINANGATSLTLSGGITGSNTNLVLGGTTNTAGTVSGVIAIGSGSIIKNDADIWNLSGANTYTGLTTVAAGSLVIRNSQGLGTTDNGTVVSSGASMALFTGVNVGAEALTLSGTGVGNLGALYTGAGESSYAGAITLAANASISAGVSTTSGTVVLSGGITGAGRNLTLIGPGTGTVSGVIGTGAGTLTKTGTGTWALTADNTYNRFHHHFGGHAFHRQRRHHRLDR